MKETQSRSILHYPTLPLVWPIKLGTLSLTPAEVDGFEASGFVQAIGVIDVLCTEVAIPPQQSLPLASHVPLSSAADVCSVYSDFVSTQVLSDGDRRLKH